MVESMTPVTIEMFRPDTLDRSSRTNRSLARLLEDFCGKDRRRIHQRVKNGDYSLDDKMVRELVDEEVDKTVFASIKLFYDLPDQIDPQQFYIQQQKQAIGVIRYFGEILPEVAQKLEGKNEISMLSDRPSDLFRLLSMPPNLIDPTLAYEAHEHALLSIICGRNNAMILHERSRTFLSHLHNHFNQTLFKGPLGAGEEFVLESIHDDETNEVVDFRDINRRIPPTAHLKRIPLTVRSIEGIGPVYTSPRKKNDSISVIKSVETALDGNGEINTDPIKDRLGMMFVPIGADVDLKQLVGRVVSSIESSPRKILRIDVENEVEQNRGQSPKFKFDERRIIWFEDTSVPFELVILGPANYLNSLLEVGVRDSETGLYLGRAHPLFELRRARKVSRVFFPEEFFPIDLDYAFVNRSRFVAQERRNMYKAA